VRPPNHFFPHGRQVRDPTLIEIPEAILAERKRQIEVEGWTPKHDDEHDGGELLRAAVVYYHEAKGTFRAMGPQPDVPLGWPWDAKWWKPKGPRKDLIRAGALCLAEKERIQRRQAHAVAQRDYAISRGETAFGPIRYEAPVGHVDHKLKLIIDALAALPERAP
jgi:hypothetical protein